MDKALDLVGELISKPPNMTCDDVLVEIAGADGGGLTDHGEVEGEGVDSLSH